MTTPTCFHRPLLCLQTGTEEKREKMAGKDLFTYRKEWKRWTPESIPDLIQASRFARTLQCLKEIASNKLV